MTDTTITGLINKDGSALLSQTGAWLILEQFPVPPTPPIPPTPPGVFIGRFRFLKDHFIFGEYIFAGEFRDMFTPWTPTPDVEPMDSTALSTFYAKGPALPGCIRTLYSSRGMYAPATYWQQASPNIWKLTGLGQALASIPAILARIEDKEP